MKFNQEILNVVFFARGGQGAKTATEILAEAGVLAGKFVKAFPEFGPERSGAPIKTYLRFSQNEIRTSEPIAFPDVVVVLDETVLESEKIFKSLNLPKDSIMVINSRKNSREISAAVPNFKGKIYSIDASGLSLKIIGKATPNVAILGYLIKITEIVKMADAVRVFEDIFTEKIGKELTQKNILAVQQAYDSI